MDEIMKQKMVKELLEQLPHYHLPYKTTQSATEKNVHMLQSGFSVSEENKAG